MADNEQHEEQEHEQENEGIRSLREERKRLLAESKSKDEELAELRAFRAEQEQTARRSQIAEILTSAGLPAKPAGLYPQDGAIEPEAVLSWADEQLGLAAQPSRPSEPPADQSAFDRYQSMVSGSFTPPAQTGNEELFDRMRRGAIEARERKNKPTDDEWKALRADVAEYNRLNADIERDMRARGRRVEFQTFGGLLDPPSHALVTEMNR